ncbi:MAG: sulfotransferase [Pseudomonadota bacterium]
MLVVGCQRSGTTHLERLFRADPRSHVFSEFSALSIAPDKTVWRPLDDVVDMLEGCGGRYSVARSLLSSHNTARILDALPGSVAVWMYREADPVVRSMLRKWPGDFQSISERVESLPDGTWELRSFWDEVHAYARENAQGNQSDTLADLYAAFWYLRNRSFFDLGLSNDPRVLLISYETLTRDPKGTLERILSHGGIPRPRVTFPMQTRSPRPRGARTPILSPAIQEACHRLYADLRAAEAGG